MNGCIPLCSQRRGFVAFVRVDSVDIRVMFSCNSRRPPYLALLQAVDQLQRAEAEDRPASIRLIACLMM